MQKSSESSQSKNQAQLGSVIQANQGESGWGKVVLDNGPVSSITIHCRTDSYVTLLDSDLKDIREHLLTRKSGHFRQKRTKDFTKS
jgi:hypothetical protein